MTAQLMTLTDAVVLRGQRAWGRIKATAAEQRQLWREVGEALNYGRALHPNNDGKFDAWCTAHGFVFSERPRVNANMRSDVMWFASHNDCETTLTHPTAIRQAFRDSQASRAPSPDLDLSAASTVTGLDLAAVRTVAPKVVKLANHAEGVGQEAETARRYLDKQATRLGVSVDNLVDLARALTPEMHIPANQQPLLEQSLANVRAIAGDLADYLKRVHATPNSPPISRQMAHLILDEQFDAHGV